MLVKRRCIMIFLVLGLSVFQAHAWPWDPPEVKARKLVDKLEEYSLKIDRLEEIESLGWNPFFYQDSSPDLFKFIISNSENIEGISNLEAIFVKYKY